MKKILIKTLALGLSAFTLGACVDMSEDVYSSIVSENFKPTDKDIMSVMGPSYTAMQNLLFGWIGNFDCQEECSDEIVTPARPSGWVDGGVYRTMHEHNWTSLQAHCGNLWANCFTGINNCNRSIYQIESGELPIENGAEGYLAELRAMRALYYFYLLDGFRAVPIVEKYDVPEDFLPEQSNAKQVFEFIERELKGVMNNLSDVVDQTTYGRMTVYAAKFLLARLYLNAEVYIGEPKWSECEALCTELMNNGGKFVLEEDYKTNFLTKNEVSKEIIFAVPFDELYGGWFHLHNKSLHPANQATYNLREQPWGGNCAIPQFIDTYDPDDKRLSDTWIMGPQYDMEGNELLCVYGDDKGTPLVFKNYVTGIEETAEWEGYRIGKYEIKQGALGSLSNDFPLFRYADVYMMKAECLLRMGKPGAGVLVTEVRERAFRQHPAKATVTDSDLQQGSSYKYGHIVKGVMAEEQGGADVQYGRMLDELGWEFAAEAHRRMDMIRFGVFTTKMWLSKTRTDQPYRVFFPIPDSQLKKNPNLKQHPEYAKN